MQPPLLLCLQFLCPLPAAPLFPSPQLLLTPALALLLLSLALLPLLCALTLLSLLLPPLLLLALLLQLPQLLPLQLPLSDRCVA